MFWKVFFFKIVQNYSLDFKTQINFFITKMKYVSINSVCYLKLIQETQWLNNNYFTKHNIFYYLFNVKLTSNYLYVENYHLDYLKNFTLVINFDSLHLWYLDFDCISNLVKQWLWHEIERWIRWGTFVKRSFKNWNQIIQLRVAWFCRFLKKMNKKYLCSTMFHRLKLKVSRKKYQLILISTNARKSS